MRTLGKLAFHTLFGLLLAFGAMAQVPQLSPQQVIPLPQEVCDPACRMPGVAFDGQTVMLPVAVDTLGVFRRHGNEWMRMQSLVNPNAAAGDEAFAQGIELDGNWALFVTRRFVEERPGVKVRIDVYRATQGRWAFQQELTVAGQDGSEGLFFFSGAQLSGRNALISVLVYKPDAEGVPRSNRHVYAFRRHGDRFVADGEILPNEEVMIGQADFGYRLALDGKTVLISGNPDLTDINQVRSFERIGGKWRQRQIIRSDKFGFFGIGLTLSGNHAAIAAPHEERSTWFGGAAYAYRRVRGQWVLEQKFVNPAEEENADLREGLIFGLPLLIHRNNLIVGGSSSAYLHPLHLYQRHRRGTWVEAARIGPLGSSAGPVGIHDGEAMVIELIDYVNPQAAFYRLPQVSDPESEDETAEDELDEDELDED